jgi:hypothetical protein
VNELEFRPFQKIPRLSRDCTITEKIDGTNGCIHIHIGLMAPSYDTRVMLEDGTGALLRAGSRSRWLPYESPGDNFGFASWVHRNAQDLAALGAGTHFGEWWGHGIQRGYGLDYRRFSLFNTARWALRDRCGGPLKDGQLEAPACCHVVPILYEGEFNTDAVSGALAILRTDGSYAALGFKNPEGVIIYHHASESYFKKTIEKDAEWKGKAAA